MKSRDSQIAAFVGVVSISAWRGGRDRQAQDRIVGVNETFQRPNSGR